MVSVSLNITTRSAAAVLDLMRDKKCSCVKEISKHP